MFSHWVINHNYPKIMLCATAKGIFFKSPNVEKKYSNYRDLIQFQLKVNTTEYHKFKIADTYEESDCGFMLQATAHGEGVIIQKRDISLFSYDTYDGK